MPYFVNPNYIELVETYYSPYEIYVGATNDEQIKLIRFEMAVDWECTINVLGTSTYVTHVVKNIATSDVMVMGYSNPSNGLRE